MSDSTDLMKAMPPPGNLGASTAIGAQRVQPQNMREAVELAAIMSRAGAALPAAFRNKPGECLALIMQSLQWGFNPFALARHAYVVNDIVSFEAKVIAAAINKHAPLQKPLWCEYTGGVTGTHEVKRKHGVAQMPAGSRTCTVYGLLNGDDAVKEYQTPELGEIKTKNSPLWEHEPDQQLFYYAVRAWARRWAPEVILGVVATEEARTIEAQPAPSKLDEFRERLEARNADDAPLEDGGETIEDAASVIAEDAADAYVTAVKEADSSDEILMADADWRSKTENLPQDKISQYWDIVFYARKAAVERLSELSPDDLEVDADLDITDDATETEKETSE